MADNTSRHAIDDGFPFRIKASIGPDGQPVVTIDTDGAPEFRDAKGQPYLRVWRDDELVAQYEGLEPFVRPSVPSLAQLAAEVQKLIDDQRAKGAPPAEPGRAMKPLWADPADPAYLVGLLVRVRPAPGEGRTLARVVGHEGDATERPWVLRFLNGRLAGSTGRGWTTQDLEPVHTSRHTVELHDSASDGSSTPYRRLHVVDVDVLRRRGNYSILAAQLVVPRARRHQASEHRRELPVTAQLGRLMRLQLEADSGDQLRNERLAQPLDALKTLAGREASRDR